jgi:hypothetical protein
MTIRSIAIAIPARNEDALIARCLHSIAGQNYESLSHVNVIVYANNCSDDTASTVREFAKNAPFHLECVEEILPSTDAHAGGARRRAMDLALTTVGKTGFLMTTDADMVADADWLQSYARIFDSNVDAIAGRVSADWDEIQKLGSEAVTIGTIEWNYQKLMCIAEQVLDPRPEDPFPRHNQQSGANIGVSASFYAKIGGLPSLPSGEDRAFFRLAEQHDGKIRHACEPHVTVSARVNGRAVGGMADALLKRGSSAYQCDEQFESFQNLLRRYSWRSSARTAHKEGRITGWLDDHGLTGKMQSRFLKDELKTFGATWHAIENAAPELQSRLLKPQELIQEAVILADWISVHAPDYAAYA